MTDDTIEDITAESNRIVDDQQAQEWRRETMLVSTYEFCVYCDGPIEQPVVTEQSSIDKYVCRDCHRGWVVTDDEQHTRSTNTNSDGADSHGSDDTSMPSMAEVFADPGGDGDDGDDPVTEIPLDTGDLVRDVEYDVTGEIDCDPPGASDGTICKIEFPDSTCWITKRVFEQQLNERYIPVRA